MQWSWVTPVVVSTIGVAGSWVQVRRGRPKRRDLLKQDLKLYRQLPEDSSARGKLLEHIDAEIIRIISDDEEKRRDPTGIGLGIFFLLVAIGLLVAAIHQGGWWWWLLIPAFITGLLGAVGLAQDAVPRKRDDRGRAL
jgi:hypothetical protein